MRIFFRIINKILKGIEIAIRVFIWGSVSGFILLVLIQGFCLVNWRYDLVDLSVQDTFYVENADLKNSQETANIKNQTLANMRYPMPNPLIGHHISEGKGVVIGYRWFDDPSWFVYDEEGFEKLSIWLSELPVGEVNYNLSETEKIRAVYTSGGSAWPDVACSQELKNGTLTLIAENNKISVGFAANIIEDAQMCMGRTLDLNFNAYKIEYKDLTPWLGLNGEHIYDETYRYSWW